MKRVFSFMLCIVVIMTMCSGCMIMNINRVVNSKSESESYKTVYTNKEVMSKALPDIENNMIDLNVFEKNQKVYSEIINFANDVIGYNNYYIAQLYNVDYSEDRSSCCISVIGKEYYEEYLEKIETDGYAGRDYLVIFSKDNSLFSTVESRWGNFIAGRTYEQDFKNSINVLSNGNYKGCIEYNGFIAGITLDSYVTHWKNCKSYTKSNAVIYVPYGTTETVMKKWYSRNCKTLDEFDCKYIDCYVVAESIDLQVIDVDNINPFDEDIICYKFTLSN